MDKINSVELVFGAPVELTVGVECGLTQILDAICKKYMEENPTRVMWPSGGGFDDSVLQLCATEREDFYGRNPLNPDGVRLRAESAARHAKKKGRFTDG